MLISNGVYFCYYIYKIMLTTVLLTIFHDPFLMMTFLRFVLFHILFDANLYSILWSAHSILDLKFQRFQDL